MIMYESGLVALIKSESMKITNMLSESNVVHSLKAGSKKVLLQEIAKFASEKTLIDERLIFDKLLERERLGSTGIGGGIAIPHGKFTKIDQIVGFFFRLENKINFDAIDDLSVDLVFLLLTPESEGSDHLQALACISRLLRDQSLCSSIRAATSPHMIYELITAPQAVA